MVGDISCHIMDGFELSHAINITRKMKGQLRLRIKKKPKLFKSYHLIGSTTGILSNQGNTEASAKMEAAQQSVAMSNHREGRPLRTPVLKNILVPCLKAEIKLKFDVWRPPHPCSNDY